MCVSSSLTDESGEGTGLIPVKVQSHVGVQGVVSGPCISDLREVRRLDSLVRAHTLLAVMGDRASPQHQHNLLTAYSLVLQIWQVGTPLKLPHLSCVHEGTP